MIFANYLKNLLDNLVDSYKKNLVKAIGITLFYTILCFVIVAILLRFSDFDPSSSKKQISLLSYFITFYSTGYTFSIVDLSDIVFLFLVSLFSISMIRTNETEIEDVELKLTKSLKSISTNDMLALFTVTAGCCLINYLLFKSDSLLTKSLDNKELAKWLHNIIMYPLRNYIPWLLFSLTIYKRTSPIKFQLNFTKICFLFAAFWIINLFSHEFILFIRTYLFNFLFIPLEADKEFLIESILGIALIDFVFIGYYAVMTNSVRLLSQTDVITSKTENDN